MAGRVVRTPGPRIQGGYYRGFSALIVPKKRGGGVTGARSRTTPDKRKAGAAPKEGPLRSIMTSSERKRLYFDALEAAARGEADTAVSTVLTRWQDHEIVVQRDGKWLLEGFITLFKREREILHAIDPSFSPDLPPHLLDPVQIAHLFSLPPEELNWFAERAEHVEARSSDGTDEYPEPPREVATAEAADILGVSKDTVLKLKAAGMLEYRNTAPPGSSRPVYAFTLRSVMELRTSYERDQPIHREPTEQVRRKVSGRRQYKHLNLDD